LARPELGMGFLDGAASSPPTRVWESAVSSHSGVRSGALIVLVLDAQDGFSCCISEFILNGNSRPYRQSIHNRKTVITSEQVNI